MEELNNNYEEVTTTDIDVVDFDPTTHQNPAAANAAKGAVAGGTTIAMLYAAYKYGVPYAKKLWNKHKATKQFKKEWEAAYKAAKIEPVVVESEPVEQEPVEPANEEA